MAVGPGPRIPKHGTEYEYSRYKCRCDPCRAAKAEMTARRTAADPERRKRSQRAWQERNPGVARANAEAWRQANPERRQATNDAYFQRNRDQLRAKAAAYYQNNREKVLARVAAYRAINGPCPQVRKGVKARRRQREDVSMTAEDRAVTRAYREAIKNDPCAYCGAAGQHDDHVVPLARGGTDHWWNLTRACAPCNISKGHKLLTEWSGPLHQRAVST